MGKPIPSPRDSTAASRRKEGQSAAPFFSRGANERRLVSRSGRVGRRGISRCVALGVVGLLLGTAGNIRADGAAADGIRAVEGLARRLLGDRAEAFRFEPISAAQGRDVFEIEAADSRVVIRGNNGVSLAAGLNWYLKEYCRCSVSLRGNNLRLPEKLPAPPEKIRRTSWAKYRYFLNYCCFGYSLPWYDWPRWERLIDYLALNGVNAPLAVTGQEAVWRAVCRRLGLDDAAVKAFLAGPPYLPFGWMGCLDGWGGPLSSHWIQRHEELGRRILDRERAFGMTPVQQGFTGHVPAAFREKYPGARLHSIRWIEWTTCLLDPLDPLFQKVADLYLEEQNKRFGTSHLYAADTFIEMTPPRGDPDYLRHMGEAIYRGMSRRDPDAVWVLQGWIFSFQRKYWTPPRIAAFLGSVRDDQLLCLDLACEDRPQWRRTRAFCGKPWLWCNIQNYGNTVFLGGALPVIARELPAARRSPERGKLSGLGLVNEGLGYNPVVHDLLFEMAWREEGVEPARWIQRYAGYRYGRPHPAARRAWALLGRTVYDAPHRTRAAFEYPPTMKPVGGVPYDTAQLARAWAALIEAADELGAVDAFRFDLVNVGRQVLANHAATLQQRAARAYERRDLPAFRAAATKFLQLLKDLDELLATRSEFLLGRNLADARRWGATPEEAARLEWNARRILTLWGTTPVLYDYARKTWSGMVGDYYYSRWRRFWAAATTALEANRPLDEARFSRELTSWMNEWVAATNAYPAEPDGDSVAVARRLWARYKEAFRPEAPSLTTGKPATCSTALPGHPASLANDGFVNHPDRCWAMDVTGGHPAWWQVDLGPSTLVGRVVVVGYYGDQRSYGFTVETSTDGRTWDLVADRRDNREPSTARGYSCSFPPRRARYLRVTLTHNSANTGRHLVEVMAYPK
jgi:alpha-N-acetylglucosaminidase